MSFHVTMTLFLSHDVFQMCHTTFKVMLQNAQYATFMMSLELHILCIASSLLTSIYTWST